MTLYSKSLKINEKIEKYFEKQVKRVKKKVFLNWKKIILHIKKKKNFKRILTKSTHIDVRLV